MDNVSIAQKQEQFNEYFMISHRVKVNVRIIDPQSDLPTDANFELSMPYEFRIAGEIANIEAQSLRSLRNLSDHAEDLVEYLTHQSRKIDLMMSYILQNQDIESMRYTAIKYGGGGVLIESNEPFTIGEHIELKVFLPEEAAAIYTFGEVIDCQQHDEYYHISAIFNRIREEDQELLVRASLRQQTLQLRKRKQEQAQQGDE